MHYKLFNLIGGTVLQCSIITEFINQMLEFVYFKIYAFRGVHFGFIYVNAFFLILQDSLKLIILGNALILINSVVNHLINLYFRLHFILKYCIVGYIIDYIY